MKPTLFSAEKPLVYLISKGEISAQNFAEKSAELYKVAEKAVEKNFDLLQIREKQLSAKLLWRLTAEIVGIARNSRTRIIVNDRADIALAAEADGVHLTENSLPVKIIRESFPPDFIIGVSAHSAAKIKSAIEENADFAVFSPIFHSPEKGAPQGLAKLREVCTKFPNFPILALGGIDENNYAKTLATGAAGFAAIRFLNDLQKLEALALNLKDE